MTVPGEDRIREIFDEVRAELMFPPVALRLIPARGKRLRLTMSRGVVRLGLPRRMKVTEDELRWLFRHFLAHLHYCPYDLRYAWQLERAAAEVLGDRRLAHVALKLFADLQVDLIYLPRVFGGPPAHLRLLAGRRHLPDALRAATYALVFEGEAGLRLPPLLEAAARLLASVILTPRPWRAKVRLVASVLRRLLELGYDLKPSIIEEVLPVREDLEPGLHGYLELLGTIREAQEARAAYRLWLAPRVEDPSRLLSALERELRKMRERAPGPLGELRLRLKLARPKLGPGDEPVFPSELAAPARRLDRRKLEEAMWRRLWYRALAEQVALRLLASGRRLRPSWCVAAYPDEWTAEDDLEELDVEASLDEGPLIPELTTIRWAYRPTPSGPIFSASYIPSALIVLDSSMSMREDFDDAAVAAFMMLLAARRGGGRTAVINFSTRYITAEWDSPSDVQELVLAIRQDGFTILPLAEIRRLLDELREPAFIALITDCGWQNMHEALPFLRSLAARGHQVVVFHLRGGEYREKVLKVRSLEGVRLIHVEDPRRDLACLTLETMPEAYLASFLARISGHHA